MVSFLLFLLYAGFFSSGIINKLEKTLVQQIWGSNEVTNRPVYSMGTDNGMFVEIPDRYGMPSGHTELAALICTMLYYYGVMDGALAFVITAFVGMHRIMVDRHTVWQVVVGGGLGVLYGGLYSYVGSQSGVVWFIPPLLSIVLYTLSRTKTLA